MAEYAFKAYVYPLSQCVEQNRRSPQERLLESSQRSIKKQLVAANNIGNFSRHFYNFNLSKRQKFKIHNQLANRKENIVQYDKASNRSIHVRSRTFKASSKSVKISTATLQKRVVEHKKVVDGPKSTDHHSISLHNRFQVLSDLVPDDDNYSVKDDNQVKVDGIQSIKESVDTLNKQSKFCGDSTWQVCQTNGRGKKSR